MPPQWAPSPPPRIWEDHGGIVAPSPRAEELEGGTVRAPFARRRQRPRRIQPPRRRIRSRASAAAASRHSPKAAVSWRSLPLAQGRHRRLAQGLGTVHGRGGEERGRERQGKEGGTAASARGEEGRHARGLLPTESAPARRRGRERGPNDAHGAPNGRKGGSLRPPDFSGRSRPASYANIRFWVQLNSPRIPSKQL